MFVCKYFDLSMPGANCAIFGCSTSRKHKISIFRVPTKDDEWSKEWRRKIVAVITRDRVVDSNLKRQIDNKALYVCEKHYPQDKLLHRKLHFLLHFWCS